MSNASSTMVTRCPQCATAFRITSSQLQSAKGIVRCGSCLHVFRAHDHLVPIAGKTAAPEEPASTASTKHSSADKPSPTNTTKPIAAGTPKANPASIAKPDTNTPSPKPQVAATPNIPPGKPVAAPAATNASLRSGKPGTLAPNNNAPTAAPHEPLAKRPAPVSSFAQSTTAKAASAATASTKLFNKASLDQADDLLISDEMDSSDEDERQRYEFDGFVDIDMNPKSDVSLFERNLSKRPEQDPKPQADESWAEMLLNEEDEPVFGAFKRTQGNTDDTKETIQQLSAAADAHYQQALLDQAAATPAPSHDKKPKPGLMFSLIGDGASEPVQPPSDELELSEALARIPNSNAIGGQHNHSTPLDPNLFETPNDTEQQPKRQIKTEPKIRAYDNSRSALLMNIIPAPVEFTSKRIRTWSQHRLWPTLSFIALICLAAQIAYFKFDYFSRIEPYRNAYSILCPHLGCQVPTLVDTSQIKAYQVTVRPLPDVEDALLVDLMILNGAPFDQPFPDLVLAFMDMDEQPIASRRFSPKEYLGGELAGRKTMPHNQPIHLTLDLVDPGPNAINYHVYIPQP